MEDLIADFGVRQLYARYTDAIWRKDLSAVGNCYTDNAEWRIEGSVWRGRSTIVTHLERVLVKFERVLVTLGQPVIEVAEGRVSARTYSSENAKFLDGEPLFALGTYFDRIVKEDESWRFSWRLFQTDYLGKPDFSGQFYDYADYGAPPAMPPVDAVTIDRSGNHPKGKV